MIAFGYLAQGIQFELLDDNDVAEMYRIIDWSNQVITISVRFVDDPRKG